MIHQEIFLRRTPIDAADTRGRPIVTQHWVWDLDRFLASQQAASRKLRADGQPYELIELASEADYRAARGWKPASAPKKSSRKSAR